MPVSRTSLIYDIAGQDNPPYIPLTGNAVVSVISTWTGGASIPAAHGTTYTIPNGYSTPVMGADGLIYCAPKASSLPEAKILVIDPDTKDYYTLDIPAEVAIPANVALYSAGARALNNIIVFVPYSGSHILYIDTENQSVSSSPPSTIYESQLYSAVAAPDGYVYALGFYGWSKINPLTKQSTFTNSPLVWGNRFWEAGVLSVETNKIYFGPYNSANVLVFDYPNNSISYNTYGLTFNGPGGSGQIVGGSNGADGKIYWRSRPGFDGYWTVLDPSANTAVRNFGEIDSGGLAVSLGADGNVWSMGGEDVTCHAKTYVETLPTLTGNTSGPTVAQSGADLGNQAVLAPNSNCYFVLGGILLELDIAGDASRSAITTTVRPPYF